MAAVLAGVVVVVLALAVTVGGGAPGPTGTPAGSVALVSPVGSTPASATQTPRPTPTGTLPAIATATPVVTPTPAPQAIVAKRVRMPRLGIDLAIVEGDGTDAPLRKAAHYPGTGWPGGGTNIYLYGHARVGMFLEIWGAEVGDEVLLDLADGSTRNYIVTKVIPKVPWNALQYLDPTPTEQLTLQTCTGNTATAPRFIVIAVPAPAPAP